MFRFVFDGSVWWACAYEDGVLPPDVPVGVMRDAVRCPECAAVTKKHRGSWRYEAGGIFGLPMILDGIHIHTCPLGHRTPGIPNVRGLMDVVANTLKRKKVADLTLEEARFLVKHYKFEEAS